jgi:nuclear pore complex protein Nup62
MAAAPAAMAASFPSTSTTAAPGSTATTAGSAFGQKPADNTFSTTGTNAGTVKNGGPAGNAALGASTTGPVSQLPRLKNKSMDDIITRWASDLSKYQKEFKSQASKVADWDRMLVENGEKIQKLYLNTFEAERASHEIERQLLAVESQQAELEAWLDRYESEVEDMFSRQLGQGEQLAGPDQERERAYKLAEKLTQQLEEKGRDLSQMVKEINDISGTLSKGNKAEDPVSCFPLGRHKAMLTSWLQLSQIVRVLNGHLSQLQWIDENSSALQAKVAAAQKANNNLGSQYGLSENDAAESFYRSYMGRR